MTTGIYTTRQVAEKHGLKEGTIRRFIERGQLKATKFGTTYMITDADLIEWEKNRKPRRRGEVFVETP